MEIILVIMKIKSSYHSGSHKIYKSSVKSAYSSNYDFCVAEFFAGLISEFYSAPTFECRDVCGEDGKNVLFVSNNVT